MQKKFALNALFALISVKAKNKNKEKMSLNDPKCIY